MIHIGHRKKTLLSCLGPTKPDFWQKINVLNENHCTLWIQLLTVRPKVKKSYFQNEFSRSKNQHLHAQFSKNCQQLNSQRTIVSFTMLIGSQKSSFAGHIQLVIKKSKYSLFLGFVRYFMSPIFLFSWFFHMKATS